MSIHNWCLAVQYEAVAQLEFWLSNCRYNRADQISGHKKTVYVIRVNFTPMLVYRAFYSVVSARQGTINGQTDDDIQSIQSDGNNGNR